ncbi:HNH endonuclease [Bdellovibrio sp. HCB337]|uniref:HNH endonuclease n=1 Tax=Bdellovibrio sp. HCB337 TaxID=3394358 RepID=UPI0039A44069
MKAYEIKSLTDSQLIERTEYLVRRERELVECLITHLQEIQDRKLFIPMGYTSLFECLVKHFKYSESIAYSRISVLRIMKDVPEVTEALQSGELNLTHLSLAQTYIRNQEKKTQEKVTTEEKRELVACLKNTSTKEAKQILAERNPVMELPSDQVRYLDSEHVQIQVTTHKEILEKIERLKSLISHQDVNPSLGEVLDLALTSAIESLEKKKGVHIKEETKNKKPAFGSSPLCPSDPNSKLISKAKFSTQSFADRNSRYISRKVKKTILKRADHQCEYVHKSGERCSSKFQMQFDHIKAYSRGGGPEYANIQLLCRVHNAYKGDYM